jgi:hypothetical protein
MKRILWAAPAVALFLAVLAGKADIVRFRTMKRM